MVLMVDRTTKCCTPLYILSQRDEGTIVAPTPACYIFSNHMFVGIVHLLIENYLTLRFHNPDFTPNIVDLSRAPDAFF